MSPTGTVGTLYVTHGPAASGKTWLAKLFVAADPDRRARENRDERRRQNWIGGDRDHNTVRQERKVTIGQVAAVRALLADGWDVIVDDTCQTQATLDGWVTLVREVGARLVIVDFLGAVDRDVLVARDAARDRTVGAEAIDRMIRRCRQVLFPRWVTVIPAAEFERTFTHQSTGRAPRL